MRLNVQDGADKFFNGVYVRNKAVEPESSTIKNEIMVFHELVRKNGLQYVI